MSLNREFNTQLIGQFTVPFRGTWNSIAANMLQGDSLYDSMNVFIREGRLRTRPGLGQFAEMNFHDDVIGGGLAVIPGIGKRLLAFTPNNLYTFSNLSNDWQVDSSLVLANNQNSLIDMTGIETANQYVVIIANGETSLKKWISGSGVSVITPSSGTVPSGSSVCTAARRIVTLIPPHTIRWTGTLTYDNWLGDLNYTKAVETTDDGICIRAMGNLDFVLYKERSIYLGKSRAGSDASAFELKFIQNCEGPAGIHAVVNALGMHCFMTRNGRIGIFDATSVVRWIGDGLWLFLQNDIDPKWAYKIFGVFDYRLHTVTFHYPKIGDEGLMTGMVVINLPLEGSGIESYALFKGESAIPLSYGYDMRLEGELDRSIVFSSGLTSKKSFIVDEKVEDDDGVQFDCSFQTPLVMTPDSKSNQVNFEAFFERGSGYGSLDILGVSNSALESHGGNIDEINARTINLEFNPTQEYYGFNTPTRFFGLLFRWTSRTNVRYGGANVYGRVVGG